MVPRNGTPPRSKPPLRFCRTKRPSGVDIPALIQTALAGNAADPADGVAVYIRQAVQTPRLTNAEQLLLMRKARVHREAFIGLMLQLDLVLLEVGARLSAWRNGVVYKPRRSIIAMAPWRAAREKRSLRAVIDAVKRLKDLRRAVVGQTLPLPSSSDWAATLAKLRDPQEVRRANRRLESFQSSPWAIVRRLPGRARSHGRETWSPLRRRNSSPHCSLPPRIMKPAGLS